MKKETQNKEWEKEFDEKFIGDIGRTIYSGEKTPQYIKSFIRKLLKSERERVLKEIEKEKQKAYNRGYEKGCRG